MQTKTPSSCRNNATPTASVSLHTTPKRYTIRTRSLLNGKLMSPSNRRVPNRNPATTTGETYGDVSIETANHILSFVPRTLSYSEWRNVGMGIKAAGLPVSVFSDWSHNQRLNSSGAWVSEDCNCLIGIGITRRESRGGRSFISQSRMDISRHTENLLNFRTFQKYDKVIETLETAREFLKGIFDKGSTILCYQNGYRHRENRKRYHLRNHQRCRNPYTERHPP